MRRFWEIERCRFFIDEEVVMFIIYGCFRVCSVVIRALGFIVSRRLMKFLVRFDILG